MTLLIKDTPKEKLEAMIKTHGYKGITIITNFREDGLYMVLSINDLPSIIHNHITESYNVRFCSGNRIDFVEHKPIGVETYFNEGMIL